MSQSKVKYSKTGKNSNIKANLTPKGAREKTANRSYTQQKKRVNKDSVSYTHLTLPTSDLV